MLRTQEDVLFKETLSRRPDICFKWKELLMRTDLQRLAESRWEGEGGSVAPLESPSDVADGDDEQD